MRISPIQNQNQKQNFGQLRIFLPDEKINKLPTQKLEALVKIKKELEPITDFHFIIDAEGKLAFSMPNGKLYRFRLFKTDPNKHFAECEQNGGLIVDKDFVYLRKSFEELMEPICIEEKKLLPKWKKILELFKTGSETGTEESYFSFLKTSVCDAYSEFVKLLDFNNKKANSYPELTKRRRLKEALVEAIETPPPMAPKRPEVTMSEQDWEAYLRKLDKEWGNT